DVMPVRWVKGLDRRLTSRISRDDYQATVRGGPNVPDLLARWGEPAQLAAARGRVVEGVECEVTGRALGTLVREDDGEGRVGGEHRGGLGGEPQAVRPDECPVLLVPLDDRLVL